MEGTFVMEKKTNGLSVVAFILAIVGIVGVVGLGWLTFGLSGIFALIGLILAIVAKKKDSEDKLAKSAFVISLIAVILGILTSVSCVACSTWLASESSDTSKPTTTTVTERVETTAEPEKIPGSTTEETKSTEIIEPTTTETESTEKTYTVGDTITTRKYSFTLTNAINSNVVEGEYKTVAPEGKTYIVLFFEVENITDTDEFVSAIYSEAYIDDYSATEAYISFVDYELLSGDLAVGKKIKGYVAYEADKNWEELEWKYEELFDSETIEFIIHPEDIK